MTAAGLAVPKGSHHYFVQLSFDSIEELGQRWLLLEVRILHNGGRINNRVTRHSVNSGGKFIKLKSNSSSILVSCLQKTTHLCTSW